jgi:hypothetical protein
MAPILLLAFLLYVNIYHIGTDADTVMPVKSHIFLTQGGGNTLAVPNGLAGSAFLSSKSRVTGANSSVAFGNNISNLTQNSSLHLRNLAQQLIVHSTRKDDEHVEGFFCRLYGLS